MKRHIAFIGLPTLGHLNPTLEVVRELVGRGHRVSYPTTSERRALIDDTGATMVPIRSSMVGSSDPDVRMPDLDHWMVNMQSAMVDEAALVLPQLLDALDGDLPDLVVQDRSALAGRLFAMKHSLPTVQYMPCLATNDHWAWSHRFAPIDTTTPRYGEYRARVMSFLEHHDLSWAAPSLGVPTAKRFVVFVPREFQYRAETFGPEWAFVGPCLGRRPEEGRWQPPGDGRPVLLISLGSVDNAHPDFYRACIEAFADSPWHVVMAIGERMDRAELGPVPGNFDVRPVVPQLQVLAQARLMLCHAGMGSVMEALYFGVPLVTMPMTPEQESNAARLVELGLGEQIDPAESSAPALRAAVDRVAGDNSVAARVDAMRSRVRDAGGAARAADVIEDALQP